MEKLLLNIDEEDDNFEVLYDHCASAIEKLSLQNSVSQEDLLELYGFFKQIKDGNASDSLKPSMLDFKAKSKYATWQSKS